MPSTLTRRHIEHCLREKYGWKPTVSLRQVRKVDESILSKLKYPEAQKLARIFMLQKRIDQLAEGKQAWLRLVDSDGNSVTRSTRTAQCLAVVRATIRTCSKYHRFAQNTASVVNFSGQPRLQAGWCRPRILGVALSRRAWTMAASSQGGRERRHSPVERRQNGCLGTSKVCAYAITYGAGDARLGAIIGKGPRDGKALREAFFKANPAFARLLRQVKQVANSRGYLIGLDGRRLPIRSEHGAINILLQSAGALIAKKWAELVHDEIQNQNVDAKILAFCHDELQIQTKGDPDYVGDHIACRMARKSGEEWGFKCPIDAEYRVGSSWAECRR